MAGLYTVICQRQMKKGALAELTVDNVDNSKREVSNRLNADELRDCFTLKESCACDTRNKVGGWPDYEGQDSLISQECADSALIAVSSNGNDGLCPLAFVHIVTNQTVMDGSDTSESTSEYEDDGELEFEMDPGDNSETIEAGNDACGNDEEFEFE
jgi:hypothetical protein